MRLSLVRDPACIAAQQWKPLRHSNRKPCSTAIPLQHSNENPCGTARVFLQHSSGNPCSSLRQLLLLCCNMFSSKLHQCVNDGAGLQEVLKHTRTDTSGKAEH